MGRDHQKVTEQGDEGEITAAMKSLLLARGVDSCYGGQLRQLIFAHLSGVWCLQDSWNFDDLSKEQLGCPA